MVGGHANTPAAGQQRVASLWPALPCATNTLRCVRHRVVAFTRLAGHGSITGVRSDADRDRSGKVGSGVSNSNGGSAASAGAIYGLGIFGGWFYFWQQASGFWEHIWAIFQGLFWPAFMVFDAFTALRR
jgi:hypothetical protein